MATQKRRIVYLSDEEWASVRKAANDQGLTISGMIRKLNRQLESDGANVVVTSPPRTEVQRAIERATDPAFASFRPAPKPGHRQPR